MANVGVFHYHDAWIVAQRPCQLPAPYIDGIDALRAMCQQAMRKAACGSAYVKGNESAGAELKGVQGFFELQAAAADIFQFFRSFCQATLGVKRDQRAWFIYHAIIDEDLASHDQGAGSFATGCRAAPHQRDVEPLFVSLHCYMPTLPSIEKRIGAGGGLYGGVA